LPLSALLHGMVDGLWSQGAFGVLPGMQLLCYCCPCRVQLNGQVRELPNFVSSTWKSRRAA
jgi:hypothetical protein